MRAPSFAAVLDDVLGRTPPEPPAARAWTPWVLPRGAVQFLFARPLTSAVPRWPLAPAARPRRARHLLNDVQQQAFERFAALGAPLEADFSIEELRRAYRRLAQRYHPDRHTAAAAAEREMLARGFTEAAAGYRCLRAVVEPRH